MWEEWPIKLLEGRMHAHANSKINGDSWVAMCTAISLAGFIPELLLFFFSSVDIGLA